MSEDPCIWNITEDVFTEIDSFVAAVYEYVTDGYDVVDVAKKIRQQQQYQQKIISPSTSIYEYLLKRENLVTRHDNAVLKMYISHMLGSCINKIDSLLNIYRLTVRKCSNYLDRDTLVQITHDTGLDFIIDITNIKYLLPLAYCIKCYRKDCSKLKTEINYDFIGNDTQPSCFCHIPATITTATKSTTTPDSIILCKVVKTPIKKKRVHEDDDGEETKEVGCCGCCSKCDNEDTCIKCKVTFTPKTDNNVVVDVASSTTTEYRDEFYNLRLKIFYSDVLNILLVMRFQVNEIYTQIDELLHYTLKSLERNNNDDDDDSSSGVGETLESRRSKIHDTLVHMHFVKKMILSVVTDLFVELKILHGRMLNVDEYKNAITGDENNCDDVLKFKSLQSNDLIDLLKDSKHFLTLATITATTTPTTLDVKKLKHIPIMVFATNDNNDNEEATKKCCYYSAKDAENTLNVMRKIISSHY